MTQRLLFMTNSIEFTTDGALNKKLIIESIGHLLIHTGRSLIESADDPGSQIPKSFDLIRELDGWDMNIKLKLNMEQPQQDGPP